MSWEHVAAFAIGYGVTAALVWMVLPYVRKRSDVETRLVALEAANVELRDNVARLIQVAEGMGPLGRLPRLGAVSR